MLNLKEVKNDYERYVEILEKIPQLFIDADKGIISKEEKDKTFLELYYEQENIRSKYEDILEGDEFYSDDGDSDMFPEYLRVVFKTLEKIIVEDIDNVNKGLQ